MKIVVHATTGTVGTDEGYFIEVEEGTSCKELDEIAQELANENAATYNIYSVNEENWHDYDDDADDSIDGIWYHYEPELHDRYIMNGVPSWQDLTK